MIDRESAWCLLSEFIAILQTLRRGTRRSSSQFTRFREDLGEAVQLEIGRRFAG